MEGMDVKFTPGIGRRLLTPFKHVWAYGWHFWDPQVVKTVLTGQIFSLSNISIIVPYISWDNTTKHLYFYSSLITVLLNCHCMFIRNFYFQMEVSLQTRVLRQILEKLQDHIFSLSLGKFYVCFILRIYTPCSKNCEILGKVPKTQQVDCLLSNNTFTGIKIASISIEQQENMHNLYWYSLTSLTSRHNV